MKFYQVNERFNFTTVLYVQLFITDFEIYLRGQSVSNKQLVITELIEKFERVRFGIQKMQDRHRKRLTFVLYKIFPTPTPTPEPIPESDTINALLGLKRKRDEDD